MTFCKSLFGLGAGAMVAGSDALVGALYTRYHVAMFALAAVLVWAAPNTWALTSRLSLPRIAWAFGLLALSILVMWTQSANPFLYFQF